MVQVDPGSNTHWRSTRPHFGPISIHPHFTTHPLQTDLRLSPSLTMPFKPGPRKAEKDAEGNATYTCLWIGGYWTKFSAPPSPVSTSLGSPIRLHSSADPLHCLCHRRHFSVEIHC